MFYSSQNSLKLQIKMPLYALLTTLWSTSIANKGAFCIAIRLPLFRENEFSSVFISLIAFIALQTKYHPSQIYIMQNLISEVTKPKVSHTFPPDTQKTHCLNCQAIWIRFIRKKSLDTTNDKKIITSEHAANSPLRRKARQLTKHMLLNLCLPGNYKSNEAIFYLSPVKFEK